MEIQNLKHAGLSAWIKEVAEITQPENIYICDRQRAIDWMGINFQSNNRLDLTKINEYISSRNKIDITKW